MAARATCPTTGRGQGQSRSERREGDRQSEARLCKVGANVHRCLARARSEATARLQPTDRKGHGPTSPIRWGWSSCVLRSNAHQPTVKPERKNLASKFANGTNIESHLGLPQRPRGCWRERACDHRGDPPAIRGRRSDQGAEAPEGQGISSPATDGDRACVASDTERHRATAGDIERHAARQAFPRGGAGADRAQHCRRSGTQPDRVMAQGNQR